MIIREFKILTEALWEAIKTDLKFFSSISKFVKDLSEINLINLTKEDISVIGFYVNQIEDFFSRYRPTSKSDSIYFPPPGASKNDNTVKQITRLYNQLSLLSEEKLKEESSKLITKSIIHKNNTRAIFIGHGHS